jgi:hypothetical protein
MRYLLIFLILLPFSVFGASASVVNEVSVQASTGGNKAEPGAGGEAGKIVTGTSSVDVSIKSIVNGEEVQNIQIHEESKSGEPARVEKKVEFKSKDETSSAKADIKLNAVKRSEETVSRNLVFTQFLTKILSRLTALLGFFNR